MFKFLKNKKTPQFNGKKEKNYTFLASLIAIIAGLLLGFLILFLMEAVSAESDFRIPFIAIKAFLTDSFSARKQFFDIFYYAAPILLTGLSVGFAFKAGLFNIGAAGQAGIGGFFGVIAAISWGLPWWAALIVAMIVGFLWGLIPGLLKAIYNINEVITTIMLNWASLYLVRLLFWNVGNAEENTLLNSIKPQEVDKIFIHNPGGVIPDWGLQNFFNSDNANIGIFVAILVAIVMHILLNKTTFGFEVKACGLNKNASKYAGIKSARTIILTMGIAGGLAGLAGGVYYLSDTIQYTINNPLLGIGFDGISVALLASSSPLGVIASGAFIGFLRASTDSFQGYYEAEVTNLILSIIIYFSAFSLIIGQILNKIRKNKNKNNLDNANAENQVIEAKKSSDPEEVEVTK